MFAIVRVNNKLDPIKITLIKGNNIADTYPEYNKEVRNTALRYVYRASDARMRILDQEYIGTRKHDWESTIEIQFNEIKRVCKRVDNTADFKP
ncbi:hypothetical protein [Ralstonia phage RP13]|nr:hypothetical protein [Ralstonia phage RP13]